MTIQPAWRAGPIDEAIRPDDEAAIRTCILDYFEGWFDGDPRRMDRAVHPGLAKHSIGQDPGRTQTLDLTTCDEMVEGTARGMGRRRDVADRAISIDIAAVSGGIASVIVHSSVYVEFVLMARVADGWKITGTLWRWAEGHGPSS